MARESDEDKLAAALGIAGYEYFNSEERVKLRKGRKAQEEFRKSREKTSGRFNKKK
jgi:hypothetical protein